MQGALETLGLLASVTERGMLMKPDASGSVEAVKRGWRGAWRGFRRGLLEMVGFLEALRVVER